MRWQTKKRNGTFSLCSWVNSEESEVDIGEAKWNGIAGKRQFEPKVAFNHKLNIKNQKLCTLL